MSIKVKQSLVKCFTEIKDSSFDEDTIKMLLITSREYIECNGIIKELAHFIAHPIRNKGMCHKKVNNRYAKLKLVDDQVDKSKYNEDFLKGLKTEKQLSDFMLGAIGYEKIESKLFEILYFDGLEDISEKHLIKYTGLTRKEALNKLRQHYVKREGYYFLNEQFIKTELKKKIIKNPNFSKLLSPDIIAEVDEFFYSSKEVEEYVTQIKSQVDALQRVIRGTIEYKSIFNSKELRKEIVSVFAGVITFFKIDTTFVKAIKNNIDDIELCIMTLLHDSQFVYYDDVVANTRLCFYVDEMPLLNLSESERNKENYKNGHLALYTSHQRKNGNEISYPLFVSDLKIAKYFVAEDDSIDRNTILNNIPWFTAKRVNGKLRLVAGT